MDEYQVEIAEVRRTLARLRAEEAAAPIIEEYSAELRILVALYEAATQTLDQRSDRLVAALAELGFGAFTLTHVYSFVYDAAMAAEPDSRDLANVINHTDYAASLLAALDERTSAGTPGGGAD